MDAAPSGNRHTSLAATLIALTLLFLFGGCASPTGMAGDQAASLELPNRLVGTWIRPINNQPDKLEGIRFDEDGRFGLVGIHTMHGLEWKRENDDLIVTTNTGRYPEPFETRLSIQTLTDTTLILEGDKGYFRGAWRRDDTAAGRITGQVAYRERIALPPDAAIHLTLEDVSRQDAPATYIASQVIPTLGRQVPIPFALYYASDAIDPRHTYQVRAAIVIDGQRRFLTTQAYPVLTRGNPDHIEITLQGVQPKQPLSTPTPSAKPCAWRTCICRPPIQDSCNTPAAARAASRSIFIRTAFFSCANRWRHQRTTPRPSGHDHGRWYLAHGGRQLVLVGRAEAPYKLAVKDSETFRLLSLNGSKTAYSIPSTWPARMNWTHLRIPFP